MDKDFKIYIIFGIRACGFFLHPNLRFGRAWAGSREMFLGQGAGFVEALVEVDGSEEGLEGFRPRTAALRDAGADKQLADTQKEIMVGRGFRRMVAQK
jgi:hypothetical protein